MIFPALFRRSFAHFSYGCLRAEVAAPASRKKKNHSLADAALYDQPRERAPDQPTHAKGPKRALHTSPTQLTLRFRAWREVEITLMASSKAS